MTASGSFEKIRFNSAKVDGSKTWIENTSTFTVWPSSFDRFYKTTISILIFQTWRIENLLAKWIYSRFHENSFFSIIRMFSWLWNQINKIWIVKRSFIRSSYSKWLVSYDSYHMTHEMMIDLFLMVSRRWSIRLCCSEFNIFSDFLMFT